MIDEPRIVVDTSALVDAADVQRPDWRQAFTYLHGAYPVEGPPLLVSETGNVVHHKLPETFGEDRNERSRLLQALLEGVRIVPHGERSIPRAGELAERHQLTFYDAEFLELATRTEERILLTNDQTLFRAGREELGDDRCLTLEKVAERIAEGQV